MAGFVGHHSSIHRPPGQIEIANQVQNFVPNTFVGEAELVVYWTFSRNHQQIARRQMMPQAAHSQFLGFVLEDERSSRSDLLFKIIHSQMERKHLPADRWGGFKIVENLKMIGRPGKGRQGLIPRRHLNGPANHQGPNFRFLLTKSNFFNGLHEGLRGAIDSRHLPAHPAGDANRGIIDAQTGQSGHAVLDCFDVEGSIPQTRPPRPFQDVFNKSRNPRLVVPLFANKCDPRAGSRGSNGQRRLLAREESRPGQPDFARDCLLTICHGRALVAPNLPNISL